MFRHIWWLIVAALIENISPVAAAPTNNPRRDLYNHLFTSENYTKQVAPYAVGGGPVRVNISISIQQIEKVDFSHQQITVSGGIQLLWMDPQLTWPEADYAVRYLSS